LVDCPNTRFNADIADKPQMQVKRMLERHIADVFLQNSRYYDIILITGVRMMQIRPVSDLRNKFSEIENIVLANRSPVFLTKNGYGSMVVMSLDLYESLTHTIESQLNEADTQAASTNARFSHEEVFAHIRSQIKIS